MELRRFHYFVQVADLGSLSRAAEALGIAQPALSRQMRLLEEELGFALFVRNSRGMSLTEPGEELRARIVGPLRQLKLALQDVRSHSPLSTTAIAIGLPPSLAPSLALPLIRKVVETAPAVRLSVVEASSAILFQKLVAGEIDMALLCEPSPDSRILTRDIVIEQLSLIASGLADGPHSGAVDFRTIADLPLILPSRGNSLREAAETAAAKTKSILNLAIEVDSIQAIKDMVELDMGYSILPTCALRREAAAGLLRVHAIVNPPATRQFKLASRSECKKPRAILQVDRAMTEVVGDLAASGEWAVQIIDQAVRA